MHRESGRICRRLGRLGLLFAVLALNGSCQPPSSRPSRDGASGLFTFVQVSDTHIIAGKSTATVEEGIERINRLNPPPKFVVVTGDLINSEAPGESTALYQRLMSRLRCPVYSVFGNHDDRKAFAEMLGEFNYSFDVPPYHFIVLDNIDVGAPDTFNGKFSERTVAWLKNHLQSVDKTTRLILLSHATVYRHSPYSKVLPGDAYNYEPILEMLEDYNVIAWFAGHAHCNDLVRKDGVDYFVTGSLSDNRKNSNCPPGFRVIKVFGDRLETTYLPVAVPHPAGEGKLR